jgi:hypothetical protein
MIIQTITGLYFSTFFWEHQKERNVLLALPVRSVDCFLYVPDTPNVIPCHNCDFVISLTTLKIFYSRIDLEIYSQKHAARLGRRISVTICNKCKKCSCLYRLLPWRCMGGREKLIIRNFIQDVWCPTHCVTVYFVRRLLFALLYLLRMMDDDECGAVGEMFDKGNWITRRKPTPVALYPQQIPHVLTGDLTRAASVRSRRITVWAMTRP